jgi:hypothetical protein
MGFFLQTLWISPGSIAPAYSSLVGCDTHVQRLQLLELAELAQAEDSQFSNVKKNGFVNGCKW